MRKHAILAAVIPLAILWLSVSVHSSSWLSARRNPTNQRQQQQEQIQQQHFKKAKITSIKRRHEKMIGLKKLSSWFVLVIILLAGFNVPPVSAQEDFTITIGEDKVITFTEFNYHDSWFENDPNNPEPWPDQREAYSEGNIAYVSLSATPGHAGVAQALVGVEFEWDLGPYTWEEVKDWPVNVTINFSYQIEAYWVEGHGSADAGVGVDNFPGPGFDGWYDFMGYETGETGSRGKTVSETYQTTIEELGEAIVLRAYCQAHSAYMEDEEGNPIGTTYHSSAEVHINSIKIEILNPQITDFLVSLEYLVGPNGEEQYGQQVIATVYHPQGSDQIESFVAIDPTGKELPWVSEESNITSDSWNFMWFEGNLPEPPAFGTYTIRATDKDGHVATVTSWPTDHISDRVPTITYPINHKYVETGVPTFRWEPFSERTTGYLIEVTGPPEETLPDGDYIWSISLPPSQTEVQFNCDGTASVPELTVGNTYKLFVFAYEDVCSGIQCYRDTSIRSIEFTVKPPELFVVIPGINDHGEMMIERAKIMFDYDDECLVRICEANRGQVCDIVKPSAEQVRQEIIEATRKAKDEGKDVIVNIDMDLENFWWEYPLPISRWQRSVRWAGRIANIVSEAFREENPTGARILYAHSAGVDAASWSIKRARGEKMYDDLYLLNGRTNAYSLARALKRSGYEWEQVKVFTSKGDLIANPLWSLSNYGVASRGAGKAWVHLHSLTITGHSGLRDSIGIEGTFEVNLGPFGRCEGVVGTVEEMMLWDWRAGCPVR